MMNIIELFKQIFGYAAELVSQAPGRLEILGNHTDYNEGFVLSVAVDCNTQIAWKKITGDVCYLHSPLINDGVREFNLNKITEPLPGKDWSNYVRGVIHAMNLREYRIGAFAAVIDSTVPLSAGMSSSASLEMALISGLCELFDIDLGIVEKARIGQVCENNYIGANTGLMDQFTSLSGRKNSLVYSEYRNLEVNTLPFPVGCSIIVADSAVKHDLSEEYNDRRKSCESALLTLRQIHPQITALRDVDLSMLEAAKSKLDADDYLKALHIIGENTRVKQAMDLLKKEDLAGFGEVLFKSHESSRDNFENSCKQLDFLVELGRNSKLCLGARLSGGGFGGISIHLVKDEDSESYQTYLREEFLRQTGSKLRVFVCRSAAGASAEVLDSSVNN